LVIRRSPSRRMAVGWPSPMERPVEIFLSASGMEQGLPSGWSPIPICIWPIQRLHSVLTTAFGSPGGRSSGVFSLAARMIRAISRHHVSSLRSHMERYRSASTPRISRTSSGSATVVTAGKHTTLAREPTERGDCASKNRDHLLSPVWSPSPCLISPMVMA